MAARFSMLAAVVAVATAALVAGSVMTDAAAAAAAASMPQPFSRVLQVRSPPMAGTDVFILQNLLARAGCGTLNASSSYDAATAAVVKCFQSNNGMPATAVVDAATASEVLDKLSYDGYKDDGQPASAMGYLYKVHIPVHRNRSIETEATLFDANNTVLFKYRVRTHGWDVGDTDSNYHWPEFNNSGAGLNMFTSNGDTPTGLMEFDLNSPEGIPRLYGPYPINRAVKGLKGNAAFLMPNIRNGILQHTGEWPNWAAPQDMPNSEGCIHSWPTNIDQIWQLLVKQGVVVHQNPGGALPYPYKPQGLLSVEQID